MKQLCTKCGGYGLTKMTPISCSHCGGGGRFCMRCENKSGFLVRPFEECDVCYGSGIVKTEGTIETEGTVNDQGMI
jgi:DnaJ-class molecular chaperone